ncbi:MAG: RNA polymerase factor sigma-54 [Pseudomonadales bacterium]
MKQTLSLKLGQQLTMTPQLQQAIRLLQLSSLDLQQEIQETLEINPMLELEEDDPLPDGNADEEPSGATDANSKVSSDDDLEATPELAGVDDDSSIPEELPVDTSWDEVYPNTSSTASSGVGSSGDEDWNFAENGSSSESLQDHLLWQLNLTPMSDLDRLIATAIIDAIDGDGMLTLSTGEIAESLNSAATIPNTDEAAVEAPEDSDPSLPDVEIDEVEAVLKRIQQFDPTGVAARDLPECLALQLRQLPESTPWKAEALSLVVEHLSLLAARDFNALKRKSRLSEEDLAQVVALIQSLNPRPGSSISAPEPEYIVPDVIVRKVNDRWIVELNAEATPRIRINETYASMVRRADNSADNTYLKNNLQEARWFLKSLQSRHETLLKVATKIVEHQRGFLDYGEEAMKPLVLNDIADIVEMHESTISRVTSHKYMHTPRGIFELKYFFSSHVSTPTGGEVSSTAIRALIKKLTSDENPKKPLSDNKIAAILADQNIQVARRTVAKYRESMAIPPSNERKRLV